MSRKNKYKKYEELKTIIKALNLTAKQYEAVIQCICYALEI